MSKGSIALRLSLLHTWAVPTLEEAELSQVISQHTHTPQLPQSLLLLSNEGSEAAVAMEGAEEDEMRVHIDCAPTATAPALLPFAQLCEEELATQKKSHLHTEKAHHVFFLPLWGS